MYGTQQVADTLFAPSVPYANLGLKPRQYDPQKAKALLEKAGWTLPAGKDIREKNGQPLRIELSFIGTDALSKSMAEIIQADMRQIGADVSLIGEEESSIYVTYSCYGSYRYGCNSNRSTCRRRRGKGY